MEVFPYEVLRCVDKFLFKTECLNCNENILHGPDSIECNCGFYEPKIVVNLSKLKTSRNIIAVPDEKRRRMINKRTARRLYNEQAGCCAYCGDILDYNYHIDHIKPLSVGGTNDYKNLVIACVDCNLSASNTVFETLEEKTAYILKKRKIIKHKFVFD